MNRTLLIASAALLAVVALNGVSFGAPIGDEDVPEIAVASLGSAAALLAAAGAFVTDRIRRSFQTR